MIVLRRLSAFLALSVGLVVLASCGGKGMAITIEILPNAPQTVDEGAVINFEGLVGGDTTNTSGVTWTLTGSGCAGTPATGCGTLSNVTTTSVTYTAPPALSASITATLTATSVAQTSKTGTQTITVVLPPTFTTTSLPNGANANPYNASIVVTGGVTPYVYKVTGNLPPGVTLNPTTGMFTGSPSAPGVGQPAATYNFIVTLTDDGGAAPISEPLSITVTPPPMLTITNGALPPATTNVAYSGSVNTQGGVAPLTFSVVGGGNTFPVPGLTLNPSTGLVTGIPTATGTYNFQVKVTDSSLPSPGQVFTGNMTLVVSAPAPLLITTPSLPNGSTGVAYTGVSLQASGGIAPYTWTLVQGQLPAGLTLTSQTNGTGSLSGTPILAGISTFTVQVRDSEAVPMTTNGTFTVTINASSSNNGLFSGRYAFLFQGFDSGGSMAVAGTVTSDGAGNISAGLEDSNRASAVVTGIGLTGSYAIGSDGRGTMELKGVDPRNPQSIITNDYQLVLDSQGNARFFQNNSTSTSTDTAGTHGEGILKPVMVSSTGFSATSLAGNYAFGFVGQDFAGKSAALAGVFNSDGVQTLSLGTSDFNDNGSASSQSLSGDFTFDTENLGAAHLVFQPANKSQVTLTFNFYFVNNSDVFFVEVDSPGTPFPQPPRLSGESMLQQTSAVFGPSTSLTGTSVATGTGTDGAKANIFAGLLPSATCNGLASITLSYDQNDGGTVTAPTPLTGTCSATPNGRVAFNWTQPASARFVTAYLTAPGQGFLIGGDAGVTSGHLELQSGAPFSDSSISGTYALSALFPGETNVNNLLGQVNGNGLGGIPGIVDEFTAPTVALPEGQANLDQGLGVNINTLAASGRGTLTTNSPIGAPTNVIFYVLSPSAIRWMSADPGVANPQLIFLDH